MSFDPKNPQVGDVVFDGSEFAAVFVDLPPGGMLGLLTEQPGFDDVRQEIVASQAAFGDLAGVTAGEFAEFLRNTALIARIDQFLAPALKFVELFIETRAAAEDKRQRIAFNIAGSVDRRARHAPELLAKYEKTRSYRSAGAKKAAKTRQKNADKDATPSGTGGGVTK